MLLKTLYIAPALLLLVKLVANFSTPYTLYHKEEGSGVSLCPHLDLGLFLILLVLAWFIDEEGTIFHWKATLVWMGGGIVFSFLFIVFGTMFAGWLKSRRMEV